MNNETIVMFQQRQTEGYERLYQHDISSEGFRSMLIIKMVMVTHLRF